MLRRAEVSLVCAFILAVSLAGAARAQSKPSSDLLLPYFEVGLTEGGATTVLLVSNHLNKPVDVLAEVYSNWGVEVLEVRLKLKARELWTADLREWFVHGRLPGRTLSAAEILHYQAALSGDRSPRDGLFYSTGTLPGFGVGAVKLRTLGNRPDALQGQYLVTNGQGSTQTLTLSNLDTAASPAEVCNRHSVRHKLGRGLGPSQVLLWTDMADQALQSPDPEDRRLPVSVSVYSEAGQLLKRHTVKLLPAARVSVAGLGLKAAKGRVEITTENRSVVGVRPSGNAVFETSCGQAAPPANQPKIEIATLVNDQDADAAPGPRIPVGASVVWKYKVTNAGVGDLTGVKVADDVGGAVKCPQNFLKRGQSMTCTRRTLAEVCAQKRVGRATAKAKTGRRRVTVAATDPANYFGDDGSRVEIVVSTNGLDANEAPGPGIVAGAPVEWSYRVTNTGTVRLFELKVTDDRGIAVKCGKISLAPGEAVTCTATGRAIAGQYRNVGAVTATGPCGKVTANDVSYYFGQGDADNAEFQLQALVNGFDADFPPGPGFPSGNTVTWEYIVTNAGKVPVTEIRISDDRGAGQVVSPECPQTVLHPGARMTCVARGQAGACQNSHQATATGRTPTGSVAAGDPVHYLGEAQAAVAIEASVNGSDADLPPGPSVEVGASVQWAYVVTNTGSAALTRVMVTDDHGTTVNCPRGELRPGEAMTCTAGGVAAAGDYRSLATVTAQPPCGSPVTAEDPGFYRGTGDPGIRIQKLTNGQDANVPPGPTIQVGSPVTWSYIVTNTGRFPLRGIAVTDNRGVVVTCPKLELQIGEAMTCAGGGVAQACQYDNLGTVTAFTPAGLSVTAVDPSYYFGGSTPGLRIETTVNGDEADAAPGPTIAVGSPVTWVYRVTNSGDAPLGNVTVTDNRGAVVSCPRTELQPHESMSCSAGGIAVEGQYGNVGTATALPPCGSEIAAQDPSHYFGGGNAGLGLRKLTNGVDANDPPGPSIPLGAPVTWTYLVTNTGQVSLSGVGVTDNRGVAVTCPRDTLQPQESMSCTGAGAAQACQYNNLGLATGQTATGQKVNAVDPSYYFGQIQPVVAIETRVNGQDADTAPGPTIQVGSALTWTYAVVNAGDVPLSNVRVVDPGAAVTCPLNALQPGERMTCAASGTAAEGPFRNVGTVFATPPCGSAVSAQDASHYFGGGAPAVTIQKLVNGQDAVQAPGPTIAVGAPVLWEYVVTNTGPVSLNGIIVTDDQGVAVSCPKASLQSRESMTCTGRGVAEACQYTNVGRVTGRAATGEPVSATDASYYFGQPSPGVRIRTAVNHLYEADSAPGPTIQPGSQVDWTYTVINTGDVVLRDVRVTDSQVAGVICPGTVLQPGESMTCLATGRALEGQYSNTGSVTASPRCGTPVSDQDPSHYFGGGNAGIDLQKLVNGQDVNAPPGPALPLGQPVTWSYVVRNTGQVILSGVAVTDSQGVAVTCPRSNLQPGAGMTCTGSGKVQACEYDNVGIATGKTATGQDVSAVDASYYTGGIQPGVTVESSVNGQDADAAPGPAITVGSTAALSYTVTNTGNSQLATLRVSDSSGVVVSCPKTTLQPGEQTVCNAMVTVTEGSFPSTARVDADPPCGAPVSDDDRTHYTGGGTSGLELQKLTNGQDVPYPGASIPVGQPVVWSYVVRNTGQVSVSGITVTDDDPGVHPTCPGSRTLQPGESLTCTARGTARACQYVNLGAATGTSATGQQLRAADPSSYSGQFDAAIQFEAFVNGNDADTAPGPTIATGSALRWRYVITNPTRVALTNVTVSDDQGIVSCSQGTLAAGASFTCEQQTLAAEGAFRALATVAADPPCGSRLSAQDPTWYLGETAGISLKKYTNGEDADAAPGPTLALGSAVSWTYVVRNTGSVELSGVAVTDDRGVNVACPATSLAAGEAMTCTGSGTAQACQYRNTGTARGTTPGGTTVSASDDSHYFGQSAASLSIESALVAGSPADSQPGPFLRVIFPAPVSYVVKNTGQGALDGLSVTLTRDGAAVDPLLVPVLCEKTALQPGESTTCIAVELVQAGRTTLTATAQANTQDCDTPLTATRAVYYFGLEVNLQCAPPAFYSYTWNDEGSGADLNGAFWRPVPQPGYFTVGDHGQRVPDYDGLLPERPDTRPTLTLRITDNHPTQPPLKEPVDFIRIWDDFDTGSDDWGSFWRPVPPEGYVCLGHIASGTRNPPVFASDVPTYRCLRADLVKEVPLTELIWSDAGSEGPPYDVSVYRMPVLRSIYALPGHTLPSFQKVFVPFDPCP